MVLLATALVLAIVLIWVLTRNSGQEDAAHATSFQVGADRIAADV
jgi:hypothetical protein